MGAWWQENQASNLQLGSDIVSKVVIAHFRTYKSPISALLQCGFTNAVLDNSVTGTHNLFVINPFRGSVKFQSADALVLQPKIAFWVLWLSPRLVGHLINRIRNGTNVWKGTVSGAASDATGKMSSLSGAIASSFHNCRGNALIVDCSSSKANYYLLLYGIICIANINLSRSNTYCVWIKHCT
ncbi:hypothetical protein CFP56_008256 [Quercus suber]|uniref:Uncharacterized protein n=1 Tax=Quercus suber TaxID=58331 RepID=A0AAW0L783_QUESU